VNSVSAEELGNALDIAPDRAALIVQERNARGPYRSIEDFGVRAGFTPVDLNRLRERLSFERPPSQAPSTGRVLDL
jgi:DNA uptake protein ComE-like DNA-binding protein